MRGTQKGSAGDSKKAVLNSLLTHFDYSKSPKSVDPKDPVLQLRRSVTIKREVKVPIEVQGPAFPIKVNMLLDSGATGCFMDKKLGSQMTNRVKTFEKPYSSAKHWWHEESGRQHYSFHLQNY